MPIKKNIKDLFYSFAKKLNKDSHIYPYKLSLQYKNLDNDIFYFEKQKNQLNKIQELINGIVIKPKQIFSFWKSIGNPYSISENNEFYFQLNIISSIIYYISLLGGLSIIERNSYNSDYFSNDNRVFPLGAEAEVIYNSKDLRIKNIFSFPIKLELKITDSFIDIHIVSPQEIFINKVEFNIRNYKNYQEVLTRINRRTIEVSVYKKISDYK